MELWHENMWHATYRFMFDSSELIQLNIVLDAFGTSNANGIHFRVVSNIFIFNVQERPWALAHCRDKQTLYSRQPPFKKG